MIDDKDALPSDQEDGGLKPQDDDKKREPVASPAPDKKTEQDPSEQPS